VKKEMAKSIKISFIFLLLFLSCKSDKKEIVFQAGEFLCESAIGNKILDLAEKRTSPYFVFIGKNLVIKLNSIKSELQKDYKIVVLEGNVEEQLLRSSQKASHRLIIQSNDKNLLAMKLKYDEEYGKFHILGFWSYGL
jgi:hypothetical protein